MAKEDDDWKKFMESIDADDEEVETEESEDETLDDGDDAKKPAKKKPTEEAKDDDATDEDDSQDDSEEENSDENADEGKKPVKAAAYKPRLKQFLNEDGTLNPERIEKSYIETSKEAVRLKGVVDEVNGKYTALVDAIKANPEAAKLLMGEADAKKLAEGKTDKPAPIDPYSAHIRAQMNKQSKQDYDSFVEAHPELVTDPEMARKVGTFLKRYGRDYAEDNDGELPTMKEGLEAAYRYYGYDLGPSEKEKVAAAAKKKAATRSTPNKKTPAPAKKKNELESFFAQKLGVKVK